MVSQGKNKYWPEGQEELKFWDFETSLSIPKDCTGDWSKYAAEGMLDKIYHQIVRKNLKIIK